MTIIESVSLVKDIVTLLVLVVGSVTAVFVCFQLAPVLNLRILPRWEDDSKRFLVLKFEVENKSRVRVYSPKGRIQVLRHRVKEGASISHWVPFSEDAVRPEEPLIKWQEPEEIFKSTRQIFPGETISFERLYHFPQDAEVLHVGLQVEIKLGFFGRAITRKREPWRQTITCFVIKQAEGATNNKLVG